MEDYELKYKQAVSIIKSYYNRTQFSSICNPQEEKEILEKAFPELKESKDERIKERLIDIINGCLGVRPIDEEREELLAWLEKQGKYEPTDNKEKLDVLKFIRKETCCGLGEANNALLELIKVLKERPLTIMDKPCKLKIYWEQQ